MSLFEFITVSQAWASAAAEAEHHAPSINQIWFPVVNFLIYAFIIKRYAVPLVRDFLRSRREEVLKTIKEAGDSKRQAEAVVQDYKTRLGQLDKEVQSIQAELRAEGEREKTKLLSEAEAQAAKIKEDARFLADQEVRVARQKLREEMADQAEARAREMVQQHLSVADQGRLVEEFIQNIGQTR